ncbi:MAG: hypothetical protein ACSLE1_01920 [Sphingobium sp.]
MTDAERIAGTLSEAQRKWLKEVDDRTTIWGVGIDEAFSALPAGVVQHGGWGWKALPLGLAVRTLLNEVEG